MTERGERSPEEFGESSEHQVHSTQVGGIKYNVERLRPYAEELEETTINIDKVKGAVGEGNYFWKDRNGENLGPYQILQDWEAAKNNPAWADHVNAIKGANIDEPIWRASDGTIFDGMHRLTRSFLDGVKEIKIIQFDELPSSAILREDEENQTPDSL